MSFASDPKSGWRLSLGRTIRALLGLARCRIELFALEWQEEKQRCISLLVRLLLYLLVGAVGVLLLLGWFAWLLYHWLGVGGPIGLALVCLATSVLGIRSLVRRLHAEPGPFAETIEEFRKDLQCLQDTLPKAGES
ncbi:MAG: phage holin family protein [Verrucomicrobiota bacterium]|nr:phage holin family protein [Limisphaera sp.]MDW8382224.1 phage holin family protein [Verrucomicrobiota bacterium]